MDLRFASITVFRSLISTSLALCSRVWFSFVLTLLFFPSSCLLIAMDDSVIQCLCNVVLHEDENTCLHLDAGDIDEGLKEDALSVLVHITAGKLLNFEGFKAAMGKAWRCGSFSIQHFDEVYYQIFFGTQETVDFALNFGPWNFENHLVLVRPRSLASPDHPRCVQQEFFLDSADWVTSLCLHNGGWA